MSEHRIRVTRDGATAVLTLDRPDAGNALDIAMADAILAAALECDADDAIRCVVLTGAGRMFCAGGDVRAFGAAGSAVPALVSQLTASLHMAVARLFHMRKPLITAINGASAGAGVGLALMGDATFAARSAQFTLGYGALGLSPDAGATWMLPRLVGLRHAQRLVLLGERIGAEEAERIGLVTRMVEDDELLPEAMALAARLSTSAIRAGGEAANYYSVVSTPGWKRISSARPRASRRHPAKPRPGKGLRPSSKNGSPTMRAREIIYG